MQISLARCLERWLTFLGNAKVVLMQNLHAAPFEPCKSNLSCSLENTVTECETAEDRFGHLLILVQMMENDLMRKIRVPNLGVHILAAAGLSVL